MNAKQAVSTPKPTDVKVVGAELYFLPVETRVPLKFGHETLTSVTCARARVTVEDRQGRRASGWGETPLSVQWVWPSSLDYAFRSQAIHSFTTQMAKRWAEFREFGHPLQIGQRFQDQVLTPEIARLRTETPNEQPSLPLLAGLLCCAAFDIATYDAFGALHEQPIWSLLGHDYISSDLSEFLKPDGADEFSFAGRYVADFLKTPGDHQLEAWHLVGGLDPLSPDELTGTEPQDGHPVLLREWIERDGLRCLKVKLRGNDQAWDYDRLVQVANIGQSSGVQHLTADFNCTVTDPAYVIEVLDRLQSDEPAIYDSLLYVEQPFPYDLERYEIDVSQLAQRKPLLMDESAHDWHLVRFGRRLGWNGVALKTCKTLTGALLSMCWAQAHGMSLMVQDLTNPMLAQLSHLQLAAHCHTLRGVETNAMQFYPAASDIEARVHPGAYRRIGGQVDLSTLQGPGFGYRLAESARPLPEPVVRIGALDD
ncbi:hypothetical protein Pan181_22410 [Aeoliella mucimassa]|uniref:Enolase C-terminal domain-containing protein n=1 Tax=Aeoliella mucimassa TaxID=2527972 RepID=A0A518AMT4_9BACT|nr:hypothetical protein Pan181_22410 [Aeoliella mucimassa]